MPESDQKMVNDGSLLTSISRSDGKRCAHGHFGAWAIEPKWFKSAVDAVRSGSWKPQPQADYGKDGEDDEPLYRVTDGVAIIAIDGQMTKRGSSFGGCSTVEVRQSLRAAAADWQVGAILLHICSPGGTVAGTADLAEDVAGVREGKFGKPKAVYAYIADMGCSAAYWVASQCEKITANTTAIVGSIGTYTVLEDDTVAQEKYGVKYRVVSTGDYKGLGADGKVSDELVADVQREVNELNAPFLAAVAAGRGEKVSDIAAVADGRAYVSEQAKSLGLIDEVASLDAAMQAITQEIQSMNSEQFNAYTAEHPEAVASFIEKGKKAGIAEAHQAEIDRMAAIEAVCAGRPQVAIDAFKAGHDAEQVKLTVAALDRESADAKAAKEAHAAAIAAKEAEIEKLKAQIGTQSAVSTAVNDPAKGEEKPAVNPKADPHAAARAEWAANADGCQSKFISEAVYTGFRVDQIKGRIK